MCRCLAVEVRHVGARVTVVGLRDVIDGRYVPALERRLAGAVRRGQRMRLGFCLICSPSSSLIDGGWTLRLQACLVEAGGGFDLRDAVNGRWCGCFMRRTGRRRPRPLAARELSGVPRQSSVRVRSAVVGLAGQDGPLRVRPGCGRAVSVDRERE